MDIPVEPAVYNPAGQFPDTWDEIASHPTVQMAQGVTQLVGSQVLPPFLPSYLFPSQLKFYFCVNNRYVVQKLMLITFPFYKPGPWHRQTVSMDSKSVYQPPKEDLFAPDLYIPLMALITYILSIGLVHGLSSSFAPDLLGVTLSYSLAVFLLEGIVIKAMNYILDQNSLSVYDILALMGYVCVPVLLFSWLGVLFGPWAYYAAYTLLTFSFAVFMVKSLMAISTTQQSGGGPNHKKNYFIFATAVIQLVIALLLGFATP